MAYGYLNCKLIHLDPLGYLPFIKLFQNYREKDEEEEFLECLVEGSNCIDEEYNCGINDDNDDVWHEMSYNRFTETSWDSIFG